MIRKFFPLVFILVSLPVFSKDRNILEPVGVRYFTGLFGHVHQNPMRYSKSLSIITCGHPVRIFREIGEGAEPLVVVNGGWINVKVGPHKGYLHTSNLSTKKPECFQDKYPKYFERFDLSQGEIYYWGRLFDMYVSGKSKVK